MTRLAYAEARRLAEIYANADADLGPGATEAEVLAVLAAEYIALAVTLEDVRDLLRAALRVPGGGAS